MSLKPPTSYEAPHGRLSAALSASARIAIGLAAACLVAALFGRLFSIDALQRFVPRWPAVKPATALPILATAGAFALLLSKEQRKRTGGAVLLAFDALAI